MVFVVTVADFLSGGQKIPSSMEHEALSILLVQVLDTGSETPLAFLDS